ncbi:MAG: hypothetical protein QW303_01075 [Nitrososphaerota archaeon]
MEKKKEIAAGDEEKMLEAFQETIIQLCDQYKKFESPLYCNINFKDLKEVYSQIEKEKNEKALKVLDALLSYIYNDISFSIEDENLFFF